jgi:hypothetical protein|nr:RimK/LysX family protein [Candidatus Krumholzibacteria bacterium]
MAKKDPGPPVVVGWRESIDLPEWGIVNLRAKVDTGARTSAIHVEDMEELPDGRMQFDVVVSLRPRKTVRVVATPVRRSTVKPSSGKRQRRHVFRTLMVMGALENEVEFSLVSRESMLNRALVGRKALPRGVLVNPHRTYRLTPRPGKASLKKKKSP